MQHHTEKQKLQLYLRISATNHFTRKSLLFISYYFSWSELGASAFYVTALKSVHEKRFIFQAYGAITSQNDRWSLKQKNVGPNKDC